jgi:hypothetical protein
VAQRGYTAAQPLVFRLDGVSYAHASPLLSDGDPAIDLGAAATRFVAIHADGQRESRGGRKGSDGELA